MEDWTKNHFKMYVLAFASHCNLEETKEELQFLLDRFDEDAFFKIHNEIVQDNESTRIEKIQDFLSHNDYSYQEKSELLREIKSMLFVDGSVDSKEKETYSILNKLLS